MKHHIYITPEGLIRWIKEMPEQSEFFTGIGLDEKFDSDSYERAIERAKAESICFEDQEGVLRDIVMLKLNLTHVKRDTIYRIELDADIQKVEVPADSGFPHIDGTNYPTFKTVAKIIPKKAEESEDELWNEVMSSYAHIFRCASNASENPTIQIIKNKFEIKRKPL